MLWTIKLYWFSLPENIEAESLAGLNKGLNIYMEDKGWIVRSMCTTPRGPSIRASVFNYNNSNASKINLNGPRTKFAERKGC